MDPKRRFWNQQQKALQAALTDLKEPRRALKLFLEQHAMVHASRMTGAGVWSFEDQVTTGLSDENYRQVPPNEDHSIAWIIWHLARIEDVTMNMLVAGRQQLFHEGGWFQRIQSKTSETGNALDKIGIDNLSHTMDIEQLRAYRLAVGRRTEEIVQNLGPDDFTRKVESSRLAKTEEDGAVVESTRWLLDYWGKKTIAGLLLMPPTRHCFVHLNEALLLKKKIQ